jgi:O-antigen/teichoic acid export membrane protein
VATKVEISKRLVAINSGSTVAKHLLSATLLVWLNQYLIDRIPPAEYSLLPIVMAVMVFAPLLSTILTGGVARYVLDAAARGDERGVTQVVSTIAPLLFVAAAVVLAVMGTLTWFIDHVLKIAPAQLDDARMMLGLTLIAFCARLCVSPFRLGFHVRQKFVIRNLIALGSEVLFITILFVLLFTVSVRVLWIPVAKTIAQLCEEAVSVVISSRLVPSLRFRFGQFRRSLLSRLLSFGGWNVLKNVSRMLEVAANPLILNRGASAAQLAAYHVGSIPHRQIPLLVDEALWPLFPALTAMNATGDQQRLGTTYTRAGRLALWFVMLGCVPLIVFARELFALYLSHQKFLAYHAAFAVTMLTLTSYPSFYSRVLLGYIAGAKARLGAYTISMLAQQIVCAGLAACFVVYLDLGAIGCALGLVLGRTLLDTLVFWPLALRMLDLPFETFLRRTLIPGLLPTAAAGLVGILLRTTVRPDTWLELGGCAALVGVTYIGVLAAFCTQPEDRRDIGALLSKAVGIIRPGPRT